MALERVWKVLLVVGIVGLGSVVLVQAGFVSPPWGPDEGTARVTDNESDDDPKAVIDVEVATSYQEKRTGLSNHESLESGNGMLFVFDQEADRTFVMREMDFPIDIIYIGADHEITSIHHARAPGPNEDGNNIRYPGRGKWVLEVPRGYTNETGIDVGDYVEIDLESNQTIVSEAGASAGAVAPIAASGVSSARRAAERASYFDS
ncbi:DUF192 domain-containing protein [Natrinema marinum]|uniref:DUF192 domain-containing protein n=1 Tax=Natrinema marinum TaxID=2961598 RepID=UPI0020C916BD|nr:DUF192 domain-containing protein [Natrinema marinum]